VLFVCTSIADGAGAPRTPDTPASMAKKPRGPPVYTVSASADSLSPGQTARLDTTPEPITITIDDIPEFAEEARQKKQAGKMQMYVQVFMVCGLVVNWFRNRNKGKKPKGPRTPPTN
jgi:hypothetical protein